MALTSRRMPTYHSGCANANGDVLPERGREQRRFSASAVERGLTNHPLVTRPVGRPHHFLVHLAYGRQRQLANEFDTLGRMRWPIPFFDELHQALRSGTRTRFRYNECADGFAKFLRSGMPMTHAIATSG